MVYRRSNRYSRRLAAARAARERKRLEGEAPDYPADLPKLRRALLVIDYDSGAPIAHHWVLYRTNRVDCCRVDEENGTEWGRSVGMGEDSRDDPATVLASSRNVATGPYATPRLPKWFLFTTPPTGNTRAGTQISKTYH